MVRDDFERVSRVFFVGFLRAHAAVGISVSRAGPIAASAAESIGESRGSAISSATGHPGQESTQVCACLAKRIETSGYRLDESRNIVLVVDGALRSALHPLLPKRRAFATVGRGRG